MNMPILKPVPIPTHGKSFWQKTWIWLTQPRLWELAEDYVFTLPCGTQIVIPKGFIFDGASIPRPLWFLLSPIGILLIAGLIHDFGYAKNCLMIRFQGKLVPYREGAGKAYWDHLFYDVNIMVNGMAIFSTLAYWAVKFGGGLAWRSHRK